MIKWFYFTLGIFIGLALLYLFIKSREEKNEQRTSRTSKQQSRRLKKLEKFAEEENLNLGNLYAKEEDLKRFEESVKQKVKTKLAKTFKSYLRLAVESKVSSSFKNETLEDIRWLAEDFKKDFISQAKHAAAMLKEDSPELAEALKTDNPEIILDPLKKAVLKGVVTADFYWAWTYYYWASYQAAKTLKEAIENDDKDTLREFLEALNTQKL